MSNAGEALDAGITFVKYIRVVLPLDGFVFWVKADLLTKSAVYNAMQMNAVPYNRAQMIAAAAPTIQVKGSLHYATSLAQGEEETFSTNQIVFTAEKAVVDLNAVGPEMVYMTEYAGIRFTFSSTDNFYQQSGIWHYHGNGLYADMATQVIDFPGEFSQKQIVSNSLPIWLSMNFHQNEVWEQIAKPQFPLFPSFLTPLNEEPPFAAVHIDPATTVAIAGAPTLGKTLSHLQLVRETIRVTMFGVRNDYAQDFIDFVSQLSLSNPDLFGIMNMPVIRDEKRAQVEIRAIAQKKTVEFEICYYQSRMRDLVRQLIKSVVVDFIVADEPVPPTFFPTFDFSVPANSFNLAMSIGI